MDTTIENILREEWEKVRKELGFLPLKPPRIEETRSVDKATIFITDKKIIINKKFIEELFSVSRDEIEFRDIVGGLVRHEAGHYRFHPYDAYTILKELLALKYLDDGKFGGKRADKIRIWFDDVVDNLHLIFRKRNHKLDKLYKNLCEIVGGIHKLSRMSKLLCAYYSEISGLDFGISARDLDDDLKRRLEELKKIDFLNKKDITFNIQRFARLVKDLLDGNNGDMLGIIGLDSFDEQEIKKALTKIAKEVSPNDYQEIYKYVKKYIRQGGDKKGEDGSNPIKVSVEYYKALAMQYPIKVLGKPLSGEGLYPERMKEWEAGGELKRINIYRSFGKIIPGITKQWVYSSYETHGDRKRIPNSIIVLDSSYSMINPQIVNSPAVVGAFSIAMAYLLNGAKVDVINFSSSAIVKPYENEQSAFETLAIYQGGSTKPPYEELKELVKDESKDVTVITDGFKGADTKDIELFMELLNEIGKKNRVSFVYIAEDKNRDEYENLKKCYSNIRFHYVEKNENIASIILGDVKWMQEKD